MKIFRPIGRVVKPMVNFPKWMDLGNLVQNAKHIKTMAKGVVTTSKTDRQESFEEAKSRLGLNEADVAVQIQQYRLLTTIFTSMGLLLFAYAFVHLFWGNTLASFFTWILSAISFCLAFRYHFWVFQMRKQRLGHGFGDYCKYLIGRG